MSETIQIKDPSPLVKAVLALDTHYSDLIRLGDRIETSEMKSNFDYEQAQRHMEHFAKAGEGVSTQVLALAQILVDIRARSEATATAVSEKAELLNARKVLIQQKMQEFVALGEEVRELNFSLQEFKTQEGEALTNEQKEHIRGQIVQFDQRIQPLIAKAQTLKYEAQEAKIKELEQSAESLTQKLKTISARLMSVAPAATTH